MCLYCVCVCIVYTYTVRPVFTILSSGQFEVDFLKILIEQYEIKRVLISEEKLEAKE